MAIVVVMPIMPVALMRALLSISLVIAPLRIVFHQRDMPGKAGAMILLLMTGH